MNTATASTDNSSCKYSSPERLPFAIFAIGLDKLYFMPLAENEDVHMRCLAIDQYIDSNGWTWDDIIEEMAKPEININSN